MIASKEGKFLVFNLGDKGVVKYDLATKLYIGKKGKPVTNLCSQLRGLTIRETIDSFNDETYRKFLRYVHEESQKSSYYTNVGTFLTKVADYSNYEQFFSAGLFNVDVGRSVTISQVPKRLIKLCKQNPNLKLTTQFIKNYQENIDIFNTIFSMIEDGELEMFKLSAIAYDYSYSYRYSRLGKLVQLVNTYHYKTKSLIKYIDNIMLYEGMNSTTEVIETLYDYVEMSNKISPKFEKYPRYLKTVHDIAIRNYNRLKEVFDEQAFQTKINKNMEFKFEGYVFLYPNSTKDIKDEAVQQSNCVASYISRVLEDKCHIMFMRNKDSKDKSLVTLEISTVYKKVVQARGLYNRDTTTDEKVAIEAFNKYLKKLDEKEKGEM